MLNCSLNSVLAHGKKLIEMVCMNDDLSRQGGRQFSIEVHLSIRTKKWPHKLRLAA